MSVPAKEEEAAPAEAREPLPRRLLAPRYWPSWLLLGMLMLLATLPLRAQLRLGAGLGRLVHWLLGGRRRVVRVNLELCFPELGDAALGAAVRDHFRALGMGLFEALSAWLKPDRSIAPAILLEGLEHLDAAQADGLGVLLLTGHFTTLEIGARALCLARRPFHAMYRPVDDPFIDWWMRRWRALRSGRPTLPKEDLKALIRALRGGGAVWYGPDQGIEAEGAAFVPFFGVPTLTLTATARLARMGRAKVVPFFPERRDGRYIVRVQPALENFPSDDEFADARRVNALIEDAVRRCPEQYFWIHRRFKHRPPGAADVYARKERSN